MLTANNGGNSQQYNECLCLDWEQEIASSSTSLNGLLKKNKKEKILAFSNFLGRLILRKIDGDN